MTIRQFFGVFDEVEDVENVGFVIEIFVEQPSVFTRHNRSNDIDALMKLLNCVVEVISQCNDDYDNTRYFYIDMEYYMTKSQYR